MRSWFLPKRSYERQVTKLSLIRFNEDRSLDLYLREIGKIPLIKANEEVRLARRIRQGDRTALEKLTKANVRFVVSIAKKYQNQGLPLGDLIAEGNVGLIKAAKRFDDSRGFKFITYAVCGSDRRSCRHWLSRVALCESH